MNPQSTRLIVKQRELGVIISLALAVVVTGVFVWLLATNPGIGLDAVIMISLAVLVCGLAARKMITKVELRRDGDRIFVERCVVLWSVTALDCSEIQAVDVVRGGFHFDPVAVGAGPGHRVRLVRRGGRAIALTTLGTRSEAAELQRKIEVFLGLAPSFAEP